METDPLPNPGLSISRQRSEEVTDPRRVLRMLQDLRENRALLSAQFEGEETWYNTALLRVEGDNRTIYLDELSPDDGHRKVQPGVSLRLLGVLGGVPTRFTARVAEIGSQNEIAFYQARLPSSLEYQQRRTYFRAYVGRGLHLSVHLVDPEEVRMSGRLFDLSLGGFAALLPPDSPLAPLDSVLVESLELPEAEPVSCVAEVRYVQQEYTQPLIRVGFRFIDPASRVEQSLLRAILFLEREQIRRRPAGKA
jgi:c-di-GMP-binding flagellar brake protein YcgR